MRLKYVGLKEGGETAFKDETRITWYPGDENEVDDAMASRMVKHPDMFVKVGSAEHAAVDARPVAQQPGSWHSKATALGMTDGNIEAIESHGGPTTERGGQLWRDYCKQDFQPPAKLAKAAQAPAPAPAEGQLPAWAAKGIDLGATDDQLEAIAQAGGPETEQGAKLWRDATGTDWKPAAAPAPAPKPAAKKAPAKKAAAKKTARK